MVERKEIYLNSTDGVHKLHTVVWEPDLDVKMVLQISHGMCEYVARYDEFARFLASKGIVVVGNDHLGHGLTANGVEDLGYFHETDGSKILVDDLYEITKEFKKRYETVPYVLFGHSMGSFIARRYFMTYGNELDGAIIMGTGGQPKILIGVAYTYIAIAKAIRGSKHRSKIFNWLTFCSYNKRIKNKRTDKDWLSVNEENVDTFIGDEYCNFTFTLNGFHTMTDTVNYIQKKENIEKIPKTLPMFIIAGEEDPVGAYGKTIRQIYRKYREAGISDISMHLYPGIRHEIFFEDNREEIFGDIYTWLKQFM